jgi:hypothetical protein
MLNSYLGLAFAFLLPTALGLLVFRLLEVVSKTPTSNRLPNAVGCAVGTVIGWVLVTFCMRAQHAFGLSASNFYTLAIPAALCLALLAIVRQRALVTAPSGTYRATQSAKFGVVAIALLGLPLVLEADLQPLPGWDAWEFWAARAKVWFFTGDLADNRLQRNEEYPPAVSLMMLWVARAAGTWRDDLFSYISLIHLFAAGVVMFWALKTCLSQRAALLGVAFALGSPLVAVHAITGGYADLPLACALVVAVSLLISLPRAASPSKYLAPVGLAMCLPFYKIPGLFWLAIFLLGATAHFAYERVIGRNIVKKYGSRLVVLFACVLSIIATFALRTPDGALRVGNYTINFKLNDGVSFVFTELFIASSFLLLWVGLARCFVAKPKPLPTELASENWALTTIVALGLALAVAAVFLSNSIDWWADGSTFNRALVHLAPTAILLLITRGYWVHKKSR